MHRLRRLRRHLPGCRHHRLSNRHAARHSCHSGRRGCARVSVESYMPKELLKGNVAIAEAAVRAGLEAYFGYPITPQTELLEYLSARLPALGKRVFLQAESELA